MRLRIAALSGVAPRLEPDWLVDDLQVGERLGQAEALARGLCPRNQHPPEHLQEARSDHCSKRWPHLRRQDRVHLVAALGCHVMGEALLVVLVLAGELLSVAELGRMGRRTCTC